MRYNNRSQKYVDVSCLDCSKVWEKRDDSLATWQGRCRSCAYRLRIGELSASWKGGISKENQAARGRFISVRKKVLIRDDFTCQICLEQAEKLHVDHLKSWAEYPELRYEVDNCRTLCMACHYYVTFKKIIPKGTNWGTNNANWRIL